MSGEFKFTYGPAGACQTVNGIARVLVPWELKHVTSYQETVQGTTATLGVPNYPAYRAQTFDTTGAYRTITISGTRLDSEEYISNVDFVHNELNLVAQPSATVKQYSIGMMWLTSNLQVAKVGYQLQISQPTGADGRLILNDNDGHPIETIMVAQGNFQFEFSPTVPGELDYTLTLTEKRSVGYVVYNPTNSFT